MLNVPLKRITTQRMQLLALFLHDFRFQMFFVVVDDDDDNVVKQVVHACLGEILYAEIS